MENKSYGSGAAVGGYDWAYGLDGYVCIEAGAHSFRQSVGILFAVCLKDKYLVFIKFASLFFSIFHQLRNGVPEASGLGNAHNLALFVEIEYGFYV